MLAAAQSANLVLRFVLELALLTAVAAAAWQASEPGVVRWLAVTAAPLGVAAGWVLVVHGEHVPAPARAAGQLVALGVAVASLLRLHDARTAAGFAVLALVNAALLAAWNQ